jgi:hypothetical protein
MLHMKPAMLVPLLLLLLLLTNETSHNTYTTVTNATNNIIYTTTDTYAKVYTNDLKTQHNTRNNSQGQGHIHKKTNMTNKGERIILCIGMPLQSATGPTTPASK